MNASVANLILSRIEAADFAFLDKYAGLTRAITDGRLDKPVTIPVSCTVNDPLACDSSTLADLLPDPKYRSVLFFEGDTVPRKIVRRAIGTSYESRLRLIVWLNCEKLGGACNCGDVPLMQLIDLLNKRIPDSSPFNRIVVSVEGGGPTRGSEVFGKYTLDNKATQFLHYPFDYFALDITVSFMLIPGCSPESIAEDVACWTPPSNPRRKYPKDFTCDELTNTETGLTATQLGSDCLDCGGSGPCEDATVANSDGSYSELIPAGDGLILPDNVISLRDTGGELISTTPVPATNAATIVAPDGVARVVNTVGDPIKYNGVFPNTDQILSGQTKDVVAKDTDWELYDSAGGYINDGSGPSGQPLLVTAPDGSVQPVNSIGGAIGSPVPVKSNGTANASIPDSTITVNSVAFGSAKANGSFDVEVVRTDAGGAPVGTKVGTKFVVVGSDVINRDSAGTQIGVTQTIDPEDSPTYTTIADSAVTVNGAAFASVKATQALNVPVKDDAGTATGSKVGSDWVVVRGPMKFVIAKYSYLSVVFTITADEAGSYTAWTDDGASGTWTYSKNGGAFIAATGTVSFVIGDTVQCKRTINTAQGYRRWAH
jgi:hypothetical protein